ncbi:hypothetical protein [Streptomyces sp. NPDC058441]|uniref:hypothetical protein n=1 Tax=Streptomyces sp. NPDC058441 TaxID=3346502 RepID=UPI0036667BA4
MQQYAQADGDSHHSHQQLDSLDVLLLKEQRPEHHGCQTAGSEPLDVDHRGKSQPAAGERDSQWQHPDDGETEYRVTNDAPAQVLQRQAEQYGSEDQQTE